MPYNRTFKIFSENDLDTFLQSKFQLLLAEIQEKPDNYILNVSEADYIQYLVNRYSLDVLVFRFDETFVTSSEKDIPGNRLPSFSFVDIAPNQTYRSVVVKYHIPYSGSEDLLHCRPNPGLLWHREVTIEEGCICFEIVDFSHSSEQIKGEANDFIKSIAEQNQNVTAQVISHGATLPSRVREAFQARKDQLLKKADLLAHLGVPIRKSEDYPQTFSIPTPQTSGIFI